MLTSDHTHWLRTHFKESVRFHEPMWRHTSFRVGGPADAWVTPSDMDSLQKLVQWCRRKDLFFMVAGDGTNLLVTESGIRGIVICLKKLTSNFRIEDAGDTDVRITASAGSRLPALCRFAVQNELTGMNFAVGIPGTVGGAIRMNAGTRLGAMADVLEAITILSPEGEPVHIGRNELHCSYRHLSWSTEASPIQVSRAIIVAASLRLPRRHTNTSSMEAQQILKKRRACQPWSSFSAGCFFKNPPTGKTAGELIDLAGLKGHRVGTAQVSCRHANFIINTTDPGSPGSAGDILKLSEIIKEKVFKQFNIRLETEVRIAGTLP